MKQQLVVLNLEAFAGLSHQTSNLTALLQLALHLNARLVVPHFGLSGFHDKGRTRKSQLREYYDFQASRAVRVADGSSVPLDVAFGAGDAPKLLLDCGGCPPGGLVRKLPQVEPVVRQAEWRIELSWAKELRALGEAIAPLFGKAYACVHVRRTDRITSARYDSDTSPPNILATLDRLELPSGCAVYIMTDESQRSFFDGLKSAPNYRCFLKHDIELLHQLGQVDNYKLFAVEKVLMEKARWRVSTFKTESTLSYAAYLHDAAGVQ